MIYGVNFNSKPIPVEVARKFAKRLNSAYVAVGSNAGCTWLLVGVCNTHDEALRMQIQADNGHRRFHLKVRGDWIGFYIAYR